MRQTKRLFYMVLLNVIISVITVGVVLKLWERDHPFIAAGGTPVIIVVTATPSSDQLATVISTDTGVAVIPGGEVITGTLVAEPTYTMLTYEVKKGDTLGALAVEFNIGVQDIIDLNALTDPDNLVIGQILHIPTAPLPRETPTAVPPTGIVSPTPRPSMTPTQAPVNTPTPTLTGLEAQVVIDSVIGAGVLDNERVVLRRTGDGELSLVGWKLTDNQGNVYIFPQLTLYKDGAINLNTRTGQNTVVDLYWNLLSAVWRSGKTISIFDTKDNLRASFTIP